MKKKPTIITNHDYISINFGNGRRLTVGRNGEKATGAVPREVFEAFHKQLKTSKTYAEAVQYFADNVDTIWPEWSKAPRAFKVGEKVRYVFSARYGGEDTGEVYKIARTSVYVKWARSGNIGMAADMLAPFNPQ